MILILSTYFPDLPTFTKLKAKAVGSAASVVLREAKGKMVRGMHLGDDFGQCLGSSLLCSQRVQ